MAKVIDFIKSRNRHLQSIAESCSISGDYMQGIKSVRELMRYASSPSEEQAIIMLLGQLYVDAGFIDCAKKCYFKALLPKYGKYMHMALLSMAVCCLRTHDFDAGYFFAKTAIDATTDEFDREFYIAYLSGATGLSAKNFGDGYLSSRVCLTQLREERLRLRDEELKEMLSYSNADARKYLQTYKRKNKDFNENLVALYVEMVLKAENGEIEDAKKIAQTRKKLHNDEVAYLRDMLYIEDICKQYDQFDLYIDRLVSLDAPENEADFFVYLSTLMFFDKNERVVELLETLDSKQISKQYVFYKAKALALYNLGNNTEAEREFKNLNKFFGETKDAHYYIDYFKTHSMQENGTLPLYPDFSFPQAISAHFFVRIMNMLDADNKTAAMEFIRNKNLRHALDFVFDDGNESVISLVCEKLSLINELSIVDFLQEKILLCHNYSIETLHNIITAMLLKKPSVLVRYKYEHCIFEFKLRKPRCFADLPSQYLNAYINFGAMLCLEEDGIEEVVLEAAIKLRSYLNNGKKASDLKSSAALSVILMILAYDQMPLSQIKYYCKFFGTTLATVKNYLTTLEITEVLERL